MRRARTALVEARLKRHWSQEEAAEAIGIDHNTLYRWEAGKATPRGYNLRQLCEVYGMTATELGFEQDKQIYPDSNQVGEPGLIEETRSRVSGLSTQQDTNKQKPTERIEDSVKQLEFVREDLLSLLSQSIAQNLIEIVEESDKGLRQSIQRMFGTIGFDELANISEAIAKPLGSNSISQEILDIFKALTEISWSLSRGDELKLAESILWSFLPRLLTIAQQSSTNQQNAAALASHCCLLAASLTGHSNNLSLRQYLSEQAFHYSTLAQNRNLQVSALRQLAATFDYQERLDKVLEVYQLALPYLSEVSPLLRSRIYAATSGIYAQINRPQETQYFLNLAYEHFPEKPEEDPSFRYADCGYFTLVYWNGLNCLRLGQYEEAAKTFATLDGLHPKIQVPERIRIEFLNHQASTFIKLGDVEQSCVYLEAAVKASSQIGSKRRYTESYKVFRQIPMKWQNVPRVKDLHSLFVREHVFS